MMPLTMKDKIGYGLGDTACGFVWQATMFLLDPCGNALEFKAFKDIGQLFAK